MFLRVWQTRDARKKVEIRIFVKISSIIKELLLENFRKVQSSVDEFPNANCLDVDVSQKKNFNNLGSKHVNY